MYSLGTLDKRMIHILGGREWNDARFYHAIQNRMQFKMYEFFISGFFCLIFLDHSGWWVTETTKNEIASKGSTVFPYKSRVTLPNLLMATLNSN